MNIYQAIAAFNKGILNPHCPVCERQHFSFIQTWIRGSKIAKGYECGLCRIKFVAWIELDGGRND